jgi:predicted metal-dependent hydrolase
MSNIQYTLKKYKKSKSIRLRIKDSGEILITAPYYVSKKYIDEFVLQKSDWIKEKLNIYVPKIKHDPKQEKKEYQKYKQQALELVISKIKKINSFYKFKFNKIFIKNQKTRWGSCSNKKNLNFNYKIVFLPDHLAEYLVVHELCHLKEMNHGKKFWRLVEQMVPNYVNAQRELRAFKIKRDI